MKILPHNVYYKYLLKNVSHVVTVELFHFHIEVHTLLINTNSLRNAIEKSLILKYKYF